MEPRGRQQPEAGREITRKIPEATVKYDASLFVNDTEMRRIVQANPCFRAIQSVCECRLAASVPGSRRSRRALHLDCNYCNKGFALTSRTTPIANSLAANRFLRSCIGLLIS